MEYSVWLITTVMWGGIFVYLLLLNRKVTSLEEKLRDKQ